MLLTFFRICLNAVKDWKELRGEGFCSGGHESVPDSGTGREEASYHERII